MPALSFLRNNMTPHRLPSIAAQRVMSTSTSSSAVKIVEVGPRDGLQNEHNTITTGQKVELIQRLAQAGCSTIEAGSFVSPKWVPQMADSAAVLRELCFDISKPRIACLVPNARGFEKMIECGVELVDEIAIFGSASEQFSRRNISCSIDESIERFRTVVDRAKTLDLPVRGYVSTVVACPYQGLIGPSQVAKVVEQMLDLGCYEISLGDTIGVGTPGTIRPMLDEVLSVAAPSQLAMHCHDTYGQALANILIGLDKEIYTIDSSIAGLGGCPYAKGASGNVATEDVVYMLNGLGMHTGINLEAMANIGDFVCGMLNTPMQSRVARALLAKRST